MSTRVVAVEGLRVSPTAALFEGGDEAAVSIFATQYERRQGVGLHFHPYAEVLLVERGTATFTVGDDEFEVAAGHIVVVPPQTAHGFRGAGDDTLRVISVHPSGRTQQTWL